MRRLKLPACSFFATRRFIEEKLYVVCEIQRAILDLLHNDSRLRKLLEKYSPDLTQEDYKDMCEQLKRYHPSVNPDAIVEERLQLMRDAIENPNLLRGFGNH